MEFGLKGTSRLVADVTGSRHSGLGFTVFWLFMAVWFACIRVALPAALLTELWTVGGLEFFGIRISASVETAARADVISIGVAIGVGGRYVLLRDGGVAGYRISGAECVLFVDSGAQILLVHRPPAKCIAAFRPGPARSGAVSVQR